MTKRMAAAISGLLLLLGAVPIVAGHGTGSGDESKTTVVFLLRHAEKRTDDPRDPHLSQAGLKRAHDLARLLSAAGVTHLFASEFHRTRETLEPLAKQIGRKVTVISARSPGDQERAIRDLPAGSVAVVAGHANTVPDLVGALGGEVSGLVDTPHGAMIDEASHDRLFQLVLTAGAGNPAGLKVPILELRYGA